MPSVQDYLNGSATFADINEADWKAFVAQQQQEQKALIDNNRSSSRTLGAMRVRTVHAQAQAATRPNQTSSVPTRVAPPTPFGSTDSSALNKIRYVYNGNPMTEITHFSGNRMIPDATFLFLLLNQMDGLMTTTRKFTELSEFWLPLHSRYYVAVLFFIQVFRAQSAAGELQVNARHALDLFDSESPSFPLNALPIPGPLVNFFSQLSTSLPHLTDMEAVTPFLPDSTYSANRTYYNIAHNMCMRVPNVPTILALIARLHASSTTIDDNEILRQGLLIYNLDLRRDATAPATGKVDPDTYDAEYAYETGTSSHIMRALSGPGTTTAFYAPAGLITQFNAYRSSVHVPARTRPNATTGSQTYLTWLEFLGLDNPSFFSRVLRIMSTYSKFWKGSVTMADISPNGHTGLQVFAELKTKATADLVNNRYHVRSYEFDAKARNPLAPASDTMDACVHPANISVFAANVNNHNAQTLPDDASPTELATQRIGGPFFKETPVTAHALSKKPNMAYGAVVATHYYSPVPLRD